MGELRANALAEVDLVLGSRAANRHADGRIKNQALDRRLQAEERRAVIAGLGMQPEALGSGSV